MVQKKRNILLSLTNLRVTNISELVSSHLQIERKCSPKKKTFIIYEAWSLNKYDHD